MKNILFMFDKYFVDLKVIQVDGGSQTVTNEFN